MASDKKRCVLTAAGERRRRGKADRRATEITMAIRNTLEQTILTELLPRSQIDIYVQVSLSYSAACRPAAACCVASLP